MPVNFHPTPAAALVPIAGVRIGIAQAGIKKPGRDDVTLLLLDPGCTVAGVFTSNRFCAAPVQVCRKHLASGTATRALVINTGNANAGMGQQGLEAALATCTAVAQHVGVEAEAILPFSTGVIMEPLSLARLVAALPAALQSAATAPSVRSAKQPHTAELPNKGLGCGWDRAAAAIMTTDTVPKAISKTLQWQGKTVHISGISKGAGMIRPNMATMLGFIATDVAIPQQVLQTLVKRVADASFNCITIDGDMSTNDSLMLIATGQSGASYDASAAEEAHILVEAIMEVARWLAQAIVRDGEGASKFMAITVSGGKTPSECQQVAYAVAHSPLVKTAFFASDPNLGRILATVGYAGIADLDPHAISLWLGDVVVVQNGGRAASYTEAQGQRVMQASDIDLRIDLGRGPAHSTVWTCDLSHDYVSINADYRS